MKLYQLILLLICICVFNKFLTCANVTKTYISNDKIIKTISDKFISDSLTQYKKLNFISGNYDRYSYFDKFAHFIASHFEQFQKQLEQGEKIIDSLFEYISKNYKTIPIKDIELLYEFFYHSIVRINVFHQELIKIYKIKTDFNEFIEKDGNLPIPKFLNGLNLKEIGDQYITQTESHLFSNLNWIKQLLNKYKLIFSDFKIKEFLIRVHEKEREEIQKGRYIFYHARDKYRKFESDIFKELWQIKYNENLPNDFIFFRYFLKEKIASISVTNNRKDCLFMNHALFGNCHEFTMACSITQYWLKNFSVYKTNNDLYIQNLFKIFDFTKYYHIYKSHLNQIEKLHAELSQYGEIILISIPNSLMNQNTIVNLAPGGKKDSIKIDGNIVIEPKEIIEALKSNHKKIRTSRSLFDSIPKGLDSNWFEWGLYLDSKTLNPNSGLKMYSFYLTDDDKLAEYIKIKQNLFDKIKQDIQQNKIQIKSKL